MTLMADEAQEAPHRVAEQLARNSPLMRDIGNRLRALAPPFVATLGRGSSGQAALFAKLLIEVHCATPVLGHAPSIGSLYHATSPRLNKAVVLVISQSGRSPDLLAAAAEAQACGALVIALVNDTDAPLAALADIAVPLHAGPERSVAATKSFICTLAALVQLAAEWSGDARLHDAVQQLPAVLRTAAATDWRTAVPLLAAARTLLVLGRGPTLAIAGEAALKLKETCGLHAEAFSSAEVAHGPMALIGAGDPVLAFAPLDVARTGLAAQLAAFAARGARVIASGLAEDMAAAELVLPLAAQLSPVLAPLAQIQSFYGLADALAAARGHDPDRPPHLSKVTHTL